MQLACNFPRRQGPNQGFQRSAPPLLRWSAVAWWAWKAGADLPSWSCGFDPRHPLQYIPAGQSPARSPGRTSSPALAGSSCHSRATSVAFPTLRNGIRRSAISRGTHRIVMPTAQNTRLRSSLRTAWAAPPRQRRRGHDGSNPVPVTSSGDGPAANRGRPCRPTVDRGLGMGSPGGRRRPRSGKGRLPTVYMPSCSSGGIRLTTPTRQHRDGSSRAGLSRRCQSEVQRGPQRRCRRSSQAVRLGGHAWGHDRMVRGPQEWPWSSLTGRDKPFRTELGSTDYAAVRSLGEEHWRRNPRSLG